MKLSVQILLVVALGISLLQVGCKKITEEYITIEEPMVEMDGFVITKFGAVGDGKTDCSGIINDLINKLPASGGTIIIPEGDFLLNNPIVIKRNFVTIKGLNPGLRSNVDIALVSLQNPGGGSKLLLGNAAVAIEVPVLPDVNGMKNRISGVVIRDLLIAGKNSNIGTGISILQDNDGIRIDNVIGINLYTGIVANAADAMIINSCWISEVRNSIWMTHGIQNMISNCQLGAQPGGITVNLTNQENMLIIGNHIYPDGDVNLQLNNCSYTNVSSNNFQSYYVGMIELNGGYLNLLSSNVIWMRQPHDVSRQLRGKTNDYGVIRVEGDGHFITNNLVNCDWVVATGNPVCIRSVSGVGNSFHNIKFINMDSNRLFLVNETTEIIHSAPPEKVAVEGDANKVTIIY